MKAIHLLEQSPEELARIIAASPLILVPIGNVEWHASHLPLGVDSLLSEAMCKDISRRTGCVVAPTLACGICRDLQPELGFYGTVDTIQEQTLSNLVADLLNGYAKLGFQKAILFSGHFEQEHFSAIQAGIQKAESIQGIFLTALDLLEDKVVELEDTSQTWPYAGDHASEWETSVMLAYFPKLVHMEKAPETIELNMPGLPEYLHRRYPRRATRDYGQKIRRAVVREGANRVRRLLSINV